MRHAAIAPICRSADTVRGGRLTTSLITYRSQIVRVAELPANRVAEMSALYLDHYAGSSDALFRTDLAEKGDALLVLGGDALIGFTTIKFYEVEWQGRPTGVVFSGDTIVDRRHWGQRELSFAWLEYIGSVKALAPERPLYWFLLVKGHRTYRFLSVFARRFFPSWRGDDAGPLRDLADHLAADRYGADYNPRTGVIEFAESRGHLRPEIAHPDAGELARDDVRYFLARNPGYLKGSELVCVCELAVANLKPLAARVFERARRRPR